MHTVGSGAPSWLVKAPLGVVEAAALPSVVSRVLVPALVLRTPVRIPPWRPLVLPHAVCLDTHCYAGGWLTCLDVISGRVWQANELGATRGGWIDESGPQ